MGSFLSLLRMHWGHEPTPNPSQEGNFRRADACLLPSWEGSGVGRFMGSWVLDFRRWMFCHRKNFSKAKAFLPPHSGGGRSGASKSGGEFRCQPAL